MLKPSILGQFCVISMLMQIKQSMATIPCLMTDNSNSEDTWEFLCEKLSDMKWLSARYHIVDATNMVSPSCLPDQVTTALQNALAPYTAAIEIPWNGAGAAFTAHSLKDCLAKLPAPTNFAYISGTAVYLDNFQGCTFGSLYGDSVARTVAYVALGGELERWELSLLEISSFQSSQLVNLSLNDNPYTAGDWFVVTYDTTVTPVHVDSRASYLTVGELDEVA